jgi:hypothetical protein
MADDSLAILSEAEKLARVTDAITGQYALELGRTLRDLERTLRRLALEALAGSPSATVRAVRANRLRKLIQDALKASGYYTLAETATSHRLDRLVEQIERLHDAARIRAFTTADQSRMLALKKLAETDVIAQGEHIAIALWRTLKDGLFAARPVADLLDDLADALDVELYQARTLYDTTVSIFGRQLELLKSKPDDVFAYMGPLDRKTRPFCYERVGKVFTLDEIDTMDNGQLPNTFLTAGGYNCRHRFIAISKFSELRELVGTGQRMPEVERRLLELPKGDRKAA